MSGQMDYPESMLRQIQAGDDRLRERMIEMSIPFIKRVVRQVTHVWFVEQEDEFSIALEAFNNAINHYKVGCDVPFEPYARLLIRNRLFDWIRFQKRKRQEWTMTDCETEDGPSLVDQLADPNSEYVQQNLEFAESMAMLEAKLNLFGFTLRQLATSFPKHQDSRLLCIRIARELANDKDLSGQMMRIKRVPAAELSRRCLVPVKTIEKNRSSIILLTLLMQSDLEVIKSYLTMFERENAR